LNNGARKSLIVNADDFGMTEGVTLGILEAHQHGIVTSTSLMVRTDFARQAARLAAKHPRLNLGLHIDLGEWTFQNGDWLLTRHIADTDDPRAVAAEIAAQLQLFRQLTGQNPTHLDSHQHVHRRDPAKSILLATALDLGIPLRHFDHRIQHCFAFYGQTAEGENLPNSITPTALLRILHSLPNGITELGCHPGHARDLDSVYAAEREQEIQTLSHPEIRASLTELEIHLLNFSDLAVAPPSIKRASAPSAPRR
jgi:predicted glycoside hydrolase/deacetylase ChbG (UPF0249 family)